MDRLLVIFSIDGISSPPETSAALAKCDHLVKSRSGVSDWSAVVNPRLLFTLALSEDLQYRALGVPTVQSWHEKNWR